MVVKASLNKRIEDFLSILVKFLAEESPKIPKMAVRSWPMEILCRFVKGH